MTSANTTMAQSRKPWKETSKEVLFLNMNTYVSFKPTKNQSMIGRLPEADICLPSMEVSRSHAVIMKEAGEVLLKDLKSTYGTRVNGKFISAHKLQDGDLIQIGTSLIKFFETESPQKEFLPYGEPKHPDPQIKGYGFEWRKLIDRIEKASKSTFPVLIYGETGVGKELVAKAIFQRSQSFKRSYRVCNVSAINKSTIDSSLFGHKKGAFTGAIQDHRGIIKECEGGTLFLDEIGDLEIDVQSKLLRAIQFGEIQPVGGGLEQINTRFIAATNKDLTRSDHFRKDLYERFGAKIYVPSLRERIEDVKILLDYFLQGKREVQDDFFIPLCYHLWPGNIRSFEFTINNAIDACPAHGKLSYEHLPEDIQDYFVAWLSEDSACDLDTSTKVVLIDSLKKQGGNVSLAAKELNMSRKKMYQLFRKFNINPHDYKGG